MHGREHLRVLALAQIVVRTPDHDFPGAAIRQPQPRARKPPALAHDVGENPVAAFFLDGGHRLFENLFVLLSHGQASNAATGATYSL